MPAAWKIVVVNNAPREAVAGGPWAQLPANEEIGLWPKLAVEMSASRDLAPVELPAVSGAGLLTAHLPAQSVTTYVLRTH